MFYNFGKVGIQAMKKSTVVTFILQVIFRRIQTLGQ